MTTPKARSTLQLLLTAHGAPTYLAMSHPGGMHAATLPTLAHHVQCQESVPTMSEVSDLCRTILRNLQKDLVIPTRFVWPVRLTHPDGRDDPAFQAVVIDHHPSFFTPQQREIDGHRTWLVAVVTEEMELIVYLAIRIEGGQKPTYLICGEPFYRNPMHDNDAYPRLYKECRRLGIRLSWEGIPFRSGGTSAQQDGQRAASGQEAKKGPPRTEGAAMPPRQEDLP